MGSTLQLLKKMAAKKAEDLRGAFSGGKKGEGIGKDLPLHLRISAFVEISEVDFLLGSDDIKVRRPEGRGVVAAYGVAKVFRSTVHRFYLDFQDDQDYLLQIVVGENQDIEECKFFWSADTVYPDDWDFWLNENTGYIGYSVFDTPDKTRYSRVWENPGAEKVVEEGEGRERITRVPPVDFSETLYFDSDGEKTEMVKHSAMLYGRHANDKVDEYLLVGLDEYADTAFVHLLIGLELNPSSLDVI
ncbi:MAG: DUF2491 family protein [Desulfomonilaceae bacterium]